MEATEKSSNYITGMCAHSLTNRRDLRTHLLIQGLHQLVIAVFVFTNLHVFQRIQSTLADTSAK